MSHRAEVQNRIHLLLRLLRNAECSCCRLLCRDKFLLLQKGNVFSYFDIISYVNMRINLCSFADFRSFADNGKLSYVNVFGYFGLFIYECQRGNAAFVQSVLVVNLQKFGKATVSVFYSDYSGFISSSCSKSSLIMTILAFVEYK